jgi:hypothetical protein
MKTLNVGFMGLLITALSVGPAAAYSHSNRYGGSTSGSTGDWSHSGARGGSASGGGGSWSAQGFREGLALTLGADALTVKMDK